jgi:hypothetical protein|uniref:Uncharacterized protein n=1 Tax=Podoviridae sp. ctG4L18 TaxID=2825234 RepID=A0A8S5UNZ2_9CAUD|nr:MAG TPA: hypothetical protein [Podoviridae sp. ctG4L18]
MKRGRMALITGKILEESTWVETPRLRNLVRKNRSRWIRMYNLYLMLMTKERMLI